MVKSKDQKKTKCCHNTEKYDFMLSGTYNYGIDHSSASAQVCICISELKQYKSDMRKNMSYLKSNVNSDELRYPIKRVMHSFSLAI